MSLSIAIIFISLAVLIIGGIYGYQCEKRMWNNGICAESGKKWTFFDMDSQGGRGYTDGHGNYCWISWDIDK